MNLNISANNISELSSSAIRELYNFGYEYQSPKGTVKMGSRCALTLTNPSQRHPNIIGRKLNIFQLIAETLWVCSGSTRVTGFLEHFLPRAPLYSDDGTNWRGAYGGRIFSPLTPNSDQCAIDDVIDMLKKDPLTRQAYVSITDLNRDLPTLMAENEGITAPKDVPCNNGIWFWVDPRTHKLNMDVSQRSGDIFWGTGSINLFEFSFIHEYVAEAAGLSLGSYRHNVINLHYYPDNIGGQAQAVADNAALTASQAADSYCDLMYVIPPKGVKLQKLCALLVDHYERMMDGSAKTSVFKIFEETECLAATNNTLYVYASVVEDYLKGKDELKRLVESSLLFDNCPNLKKSIESSKFYNS